MTRLISREFVQTHLPIFQVRPELGVSIQSIETDHLLSGESLRQYLLTLCEYKSAGPLKNVSFLNVGITNMGVQPLFLKIESRAAP